MNDLRPCPFCAHDKPMLATGGNEQLHFFVVTWAECGAVAPRAHKRRSTRTCRAFVESAIRIPMTFGGYSIRSDCESVFDPGEGQIAFSLKWRLSNANAPLLASPPWTMTPRHGGPNRAGPAHTPRPRPARRLSASGCSNSARASLSRSIECNRSRARVSFGSRVVCLAAASAKAPRRAASAMRPASALRSATWSK